MVKKTILFSIFSCIIIVGVSIFLSFKFKKADTSNASYEKYATEMQLVCPANITVPTNEKVFLADGYLRVLPAESKSKLTCSVSAYSSANKDKAVFSLEDNSFIASNDGSYKVVFSVPSSENAFIKRTLIIKASSTKQSEDVELLLPELKTDSSYKINEIFNVKNPNITVEYQSLSQCLEIVNGVAFPTKTGTAKVKVLVANDYVSYSYIFSIKIKLSSGLDDGNYKPEIGGDKETTDGESDSLSPKIEILNVFAEPSGKCSIDYIVSDFDGGQELEIIECSSNLYITMKYSSPPTIWIGYNSKGISYIKVRLVQDASIEFVIEFEIV